MKPMTLVRLTVAAAMLSPIAVAATRSAPHAQAADVQPVAVSASLTAELGRELQARRASSGRDPLWSRSAYTVRAQAMATTLATNDGVSAPAGPSDRAPSSWGWGSALAPLADGQATTTIRSVADSMANVLASPYYTDGGWAVATRTDDRGVMHIGVAAIAGWPDPSVAAASGCSASGYCWSARGLNPHLPWTRNQVKVYLSTSGLPTGGESVVKAAITKLNAISGFGAHLVYGGRTSVTAPSGAVHFVVRWADGGCSVANAAGCAISTTRNGMVTESRVLVMNSQWRARPGSVFWTGVLMHELGHSMGLAHFDKTYAGRYQLMRWSGGPSTAQSGDGNGLRAINKPGALSAVLGLPESVGSGEAVSANVQAGSGGLGGLRSVRIDCTDSAGTWRTVSSRAGAWDIRTGNYAMTWTVPATARYTASCRAVVKSKLLSYTSATKTMVLGG